MVGLFINTIPLRVTAEKEETVAELIRKQQNKGIESTNYDFCSLADIQNKTVQGANLIKILYVFENYMSGTSGENDEIEGIHTTVEKSREQTNYGITISGFEINAKLGFKIMYDPNKYCEDEIQAILDLLLVICEKISEDADVKVCELDKLTSRDERLWKKYNKTEVDIAKESLINLVHKQCQKTPDRIAVVNGTEELTYAELWEKAGRVAGYLHAKGYGKNEYITVR